jgi:RadC-like JAB domain
MRKGSRHSASAHGSRSMARWVRQDGGRVVRSSGPYGPLHRRPRLRHGSRRRGAASAASRPPQARARAVRTCVPVSAAARGPASAAAATLSPSDSSRCLSGCQATFRPPSARQRAHTDATPCLTSSSPRGRTWKAPAPRRSARATGSCPPHPPPEGVLRLAMPPWASSPHGVPASLPLWSFLPPWTASLRCNSPDDAQPSRRPGPAPPSARACGLLPSLPRSALAPQTALWGRRAGSSCACHPSGAPQPSQEDLALTKRLVDAGKLLGIAVLDHLILGDGTETYFSFADEQLL